MENIRFEFNCRVIRKTEEGFSAILDDKDFYLIKFRDSKFHYFFDVKDTLKISIENVAEINKEEIKEEYAIIYVTLHSFLSNGFLFRDTSSKKVFFWERRGMITHKAFEKNDYWGEDDILKIVMRKI